MKYSLIERCNQSSLQSARIDSISSSSIYYSSAKSVRTSSIKAKISLNGLLVELQLQHLIKHYLNVINLTKKYLNNN